MRIVMPFGNYIPGSSWLHKLDARFKLLLTAAYVFAVFAVQSWLGVLLCSGILLAAAITAGIPLRRLARGLLPIIMILAFTLLAHAFTLSPQTQAWPEQAPAPFCEWPAFANIPIFGQLAASPAGAISGMFFVLRIVALVSATTLLTLSSPLLGIANAIAALLRPLARLRVPVEDIAMMFSIALRFIPLTAQEAEKIKYALQARGLRFDQGNVATRLRAYTPVLVPLFVSLFRRADSLACAMESRCYDGSSRTRPSSERICARDLAYGIIGSSLLVILAVLL
jgi:energy-coupling factor transport system permease protein